MAISCWKNDHRKKEYGYFMIFARILLWIFIFTTSLFDGVFFFGQLSGLQKLYNVILAFGLYTHTAKPGSNQFGIMRTNMKNTLSANLPGRI
jgi:hypothetical protein